MVSTLVYRLRVLTSSIMVGIDWFMSSFDELWSCSGNTLSNSAQGASAVVESCCGMLNLLYYRAWLQQVELGPLILDGGASDNSEEGAARGGD